MWLLVEKDMKNLPKSTRLDSFSFTLVVVISECNRIEHPLVNTLTILSDHIRSINVPKAVDRTSIKIPTIHITYQSTHSDSTIYPTDAIAVLHIIGRAIAY
jgi:hypothetical protein